MNTRITTDIPVDLYFKYRDALREKKIKNIAIGIDTNTNVCYIICSSRQLAVYIKLFGPHTYMKRLIGE